jgi:cell shape-determining protein MreD
MYSKIILNILLIFTLTFIQFSFISALPGWFHDINLLLIALIFILGLSGLNLALWWAIGIGIILDTFSFTPFGIYLFSLCLVVFLSNLLLINFFTNRSLYSFLALTLFIFVLYVFILSFVNYFLRLFNFDADYFPFSDIFGLNLLAQIFWNLFFVVIIFYAINFISNRFKPAFLIKK